MSESGAAVLVTRARAQAADLVSAIERAGGRAVVHPVIAIAPPQDPGPLQQAAEHVGDYDWVLLTSVNAAEALLDRLAPGVSPRAVACVGASTAQACEGRGVRVDLVPDTFHAEALLQALSARLGPRLAGARFLMPRAEEGREVLPDGLRALGAEVDVVVAYRTVPDVAEREALAARLAAGEIHVLTFASPSAVTFFHSLLDATPVLDVALGLPAICIGRVTALRAEQLGFRCVEVAARADAESLGRLACERNATAR